MNVSRTVQQGRERTLANGGAGFRSLQAMREAARAQQARCSEVEAKGSGVLFVAKSDGLAVDLGGSMGADAFTPWALRQVGSIAGVPGDVVDRLTPATAARVLNECWPREADARRFLLEASGDNDETSTLRAVVSPTYRRVWDAELLGEVERWLAPAGWEAAYPTINHGGQAEADRERALWRSDRDSFAFFMSKRNEGDAGTSDGLGGMRRGLFVGNSEVGARSLVWGSMWFRDVCSNFLVWDAKGEESHRRRHTAGIVGEVADLRRWIREAVPTVGTPDLAPFVILNEKAFPVPDGKDAWEERFARSVAARFDVTQAQARSAFAQMGKGTGARPGSYFDVVNGLTAAARDLAPAARFDLSTAAGKVASAGLA